MAAPSLRATIEVEMAHADDFCELVSQALGGDVFHAPLLVTPDRSWHYADAALSCRLGYGHTHARITIRNSPAACDWFRRVAPDWQPIPTRQVAASADAATEALAA